MKNNSDNVYDNTTLSRYALWADMLRIQYETSRLRNYSELRTQLQTEQFVFDRKLLETEMYMFLWLGVLYTVIEGWPRLKHNCPRITTLLRNSNKELLHDFRNAIFHPEDFNDPRIKALKNKGQNSVDWARELTFEFVSFFRNTLHLFD